ncbi:MAG: hypothetical protein JNL98_30135, partial [Bryobacterales bacterium]|nr:hypothetical protein [Bryobacterales bacterium]
MIRPLILIALIISSLLAQQAAAPQGSKAKGGETKFGIRVQEGPMDALRVKDYKPSSSLVVARTEVAKARFAVIDAHSHASMSGIKTRADVDAWVKTMDETGIEMSVVFTETTGAEFDRLADLFLQSYPKRFQVWCGIDTKDIDDPGYPERAARELERCYRKGARGAG